MARHLQHEIAARAVHPIKRDEMRAGFDAGERGRPARVYFDRADRVRLARVLRTLVARLPGRADAADEIERGVEFFRQLDSDLAVADPEGVLAHACFSGSQWGPLIAARVGRQALSLCLP